MAKRILIVDDEADMVEVTGIRLEKAGYQISTAASGEEALEFLRKNIPDLILLDLLLPHIQGEELCKQFKNDPRLKHIPIILFTASTNDIQKIAKNINADDYITKPYDPQLLLKKIKKLI